MSDNGGIPDNAPTPSGRLAAGWCRLVRAVRAIDDCWIGDVIGALSLGGLAWFLSLFLMVIG